MMTWRRCGWLGERWRGWERSGGVVGWERGGEDGRDEQQRMVERRRAEQTGGEDVREEDSWQERRGGFEIAADDGREHQRW
jgi:hypothetical protein